MDISNAYKQHQQIILLQEELQETETEIRFTDRAYNLAFIATFVLYFIFIWMMYVSDLWGFTTWLVQNLSEVAALIIYGVLATTLPLTMAMIKEIGYKHFAKYPNPKYIVFMVVGILAFAGVIYEAISSSSQQQHISTANAENSKAFAAISGTSINVVGTGGSALADAQGELAKTRQYLATCKRTCSTQKAKVAELEAKVSALQSSQQDAHRAAETAGANAMQAKAQAMRDIKEDAYKPVFKAIRDSLGVSISTGVMLVTLFISVIFEVSHLLLILFRAQQRQRRDGLKQSIIVLDANYMQATGKTFDGADFAEYSQGGIPRPDPVKRQPFGFVPAAASTPLFRYQEPASRPAGFAPWPGSKPKDKTVSSQPAPGQYWDTDPAKPVLRDAVNHPAPASPELPKGSKGSDTSPATSPNFLKGERGSEFDQFYALFKKHVLAGGRFSEPACFELRKDSPFFSQLGKVNMNPIWNECLDRMAGEGILMANPNYAEGSTRPRYVLNPSHKKAA